MKVFALIFTALLIPSAFAADLAVNADIPPEISYDTIQTYPDGLTFIEMPRIYRTLLGAITTGSAENNATVFCMKLGMQYYDVTVAVIGRGEVVNYDISADGQITGPFFSQAATIASRVICKR